MRQGSGSRQPPEVPFFRDLLQVLGSGEGGMTLKGLLTRVTFHSLFSAAVFFSAAVLAAALAPTSAALAVSEQRYSCRASTVRVLGLEPVVSNPSREPCADALSWSPQLNVGPVRATALRATTSVITPPRAPASFEGGEAKATAAGVDISVAGYRLRADLLTAEVLAGCEAGKPVLRGASAALGLTINDIPVPTTERQDVPLAGLGTLHLNHLVIEPGKTLRRALWLETTAGEGVVVAEAVAGVNGRCTTPGVLTIVKDAQPDDAQDFSFRGDLGEFSLDDDDDARLPNRRSFTTRPGTHVIAEVPRSRPVPGRAREVWALVAISCQDPDGGTVADVATGTATIDLDAGESVSCSFRNRRMTALETIALQPKVEENLNTGAPSAGSPAMEVAGPDPRGGEDQDRRSPRPQSATASPGLLQPILLLGVPSLALLIAAFFVIGFVRRRSE